MVMSDVPALAVAILAVLAFLYALEKESLVASALCGLLVGLSVTIRISNGAILVGMLAAALLVLPLRLNFALAMAFAIGFIGFPASAGVAEFALSRFDLLNGYAFWLPDFYNSAVFKTFKLSYLVVPADPIYQHGNFVAYALALLGIDGIFGQLHLGTESRTLVHARYALYPFPVVVFAAIGVFSAMRHQARRQHDARAVFGPDLSCLAGAHLSPLFPCRTPLHAAGVVYHFCGSGLGAGPRESKSWSGDGRDLR